MDVIKSVIVWFIGICFVVVFFPFTLLIWLLVLPFDRNRSVTHWILMNQSYLLVKLIPLWKLSIEGREKAIRGRTYVIISNHKSLIDILLANCLRYRYKWISKIENMKLPVLGWYLRMADYITVDRGDDESKAEMLSKSYDSLKKGISIMIFPEGTRIPGNGMGFFKRGAFALAIDANVPILPVLIDGTGEILPKHGLIFRSGYHLRVRVLDPIPPDSFGTPNPEELAVKIRALMAVELEKFGNNNSRNDTQQLVSQDIKQDGLL
jgi:1-acyl-sn-glycerol-3-phosphate acyltransferase